MTSQMTTTIILNPVTEYDVVRQYEQDSGWIKTVESTVGIMFECKSPQYVTDAVYIPSNNPYDRADMRGTENE